MFRIRFCRTIPDRFLIYSVFTSSSAVSNTPVVEPRESEGSAKRGRIARALSVGCFSCILRGRTTGRWSSAICAVCYVGPVPPHWVWRLLLRPRRSSPLNVFLDNSTFRFSIRNSRKIGPFLHTSTALFYLLTRHSRNQKLNFIIGHITLSISRSYNTISINHDQHAIDSSRKVLSSYSNVIL